jgi:hypothetical protein
MYEAQAVLVKFIRPEHCVKDDQTLPVEGRFYGVRRINSAKKNCLQATTTALKSGMTLTF